MNIQEQITKYISTQSEPKRFEIETLNQLITQALPNCKLWYFDGTDESGKMVTNPQIGYGLQTLKYADGKTKDFYQIGLSANKTGISVYILGIKDKNYLPNTFGKNIGKAKVTGYCINFKSLQDIDIDMLKAAILYGVHQRKSTNY